MILDETRKAITTDFLVPAVRAPKWILFGNHRQLHLYVDLDELETVVSERVKRAAVQEPDGSWVREVSSRLRQHCDNRRYTARKRLANTRHDLVGKLTCRFKIEEADFEKLVTFDVDPDNRCAAYRTAPSSHGDARAMNSQGRPPGQQQCSRSKGRHR